MVPVKLEYQNSYQAELGVKLELMNAIKIMESLLVSTILVVNSCDNIITLRQAAIHP